MNIGSYLVLCVGDLRLNARSKLSIATARAGRHVMHVEENTVRREVPVGCWTTEAHGGVPSWEQELPGDKNIA